MKQILILSSLVFLVSCSNHKNPQASDPYKGYITTPTGLKYKILEKGSGDQAKVGQEVMIPETTSYRNGTVLYSNEKTGSPVKVLIGGNQATSAVDEGLRGMRVGEVRFLVAPPELVKRKSYPSNVSPDSTLTIKIILQKIL